MFTVGLSNEVGFVQDVQPGGGMIQWLVHFPREGAFHLKPTDLPWFHVPPLAECQLCFSESECLALAVRFTASSLGQAGLGAVPACGMDAAESENSPSFDSSCDPGTTWFETKKSWKGNQDNGAKPKT